MADGGLDSYSSSSSTTLTKAPKGFRSYEDLDGDRNVLKTTVECFGGQVTDTKAWQTFTLPGNSQPLSLFPATGTLCIYSASGNPCVPSVPGNRENVSSASGNKNVPLGTWQQQRSLDI